MSLDIIRGAYDKPVSTHRLISTLETIQIERGILFTGYPIIGASVDQYSLDAVLITPLIGIILFDIVEGPDFTDRSEIRDSLINAMMSRLLNVKGLAKRRELDFDLSVITYAPAWSKAQTPQDDELIINDEELINFIQDSENESNKDKYERVVGAVQAITQLKKRPPRKVLSETSKGAIMNEVEKSIANLDKYQSKAVIETVQGIQRIRGLAGSGKTVILALKAAYLHSKFPDWKIGITYYTRSLKSQFHDLITKFTIEHKNEEPDWSKVRIMQAWGGPTVEGIYYQFCKSNGVDYHSYESAVSKFGQGQDLIGLICEEAMKQVTNPKDDFDVILLDEAQDFSEPFLLLCYMMLKSADKNNPANRRLVYAYDELQKLNNFSLRTPKEIFGPRIDFDADKDKPIQDVILRVCYRNSAPVLVTAHALGFGIYRKSDNDTNVNVVTMFQEKELWTDVGYRVCGGELELGSYVELERDSDTSPELITSRVPADDLIQFWPFESSEDQYDWIVREIEKNLNEDELDYRDIIVIHPNPYKTKSETSIIRGKLARKGINSHLAGVNTSPDDFFLKESIAFTSIYRAKGNEASMVYIMNTNYCFSGYELIKKRNTLFTAITRSKGWVRACGFGPGIDGLVEEYEQVRQSGYKLKFTYPTRDQMNDLNVIHRELTGEEKRKIQEGNIELKGLVGKLEGSEIKVADLSKEEIERLKKLLDDTK